MRGLLYDVHGNLPALEAVLADAETVGVDRWLLGGDYALFGGWPAETLELLGELPDAIWLRGNGERWAAAPDQAPDDPVVQGAIGAVLAILGPVEVAEQARLPESAELDPGTRAWHGSPVSDVRSFLPDPMPEDAELLEGVTDQRLVFGHTHVPFIRFDAEHGVELVNPGSVGMPFDGNPRAAWAVIHPDGTVEHRRARYDHAAAARRVRAIAGEDRWGEVVAQRIERAQFVVR
jgi:diadenosine tetraphosphatase ApaH/serine/threonine PP2A family protein phosphatase